jgi:hypothetical protein
MTRRHWAAGGLVLLLAGLGVGLGLGLTGGGSRAAASCHPKLVPQRIGESIEATRLPKGMVVTAGATTDPRFGPFVYSVPGLKEGPYVQLDVMGGVIVSGPAPAYFTTQTVTVEGHPAVLAQPPSFLTKAQTPQIGLGYLYWQPVTGTLIVMKTYELAPSAMLYVADSVVYAPGKVTPERVGCPVQVSQPSA